MYLLLGHCYRIIGKLSEADTKYQTAKDIAQSISCKDCVKLAFIYQQFCIYSTGNNEKPLTELRPLVNDTDITSSTKGTLHQLLGNIYRSAADWHSAKHHFKQSISLAKEEDDQHKVMERKAELGRVYRSSGCYPKALKRQLKFLHYSRDQGNRYDIATACGYIGFTNYSMGKSHYQEAVKFLNCKLELSKNELGDVSGYRWCLNNIGKVYIAINECEMAIKLFTESSKIAKEIGNMLGLGTAYGNLGSAFRGIGKHHEAVKYHRLYLEIAESSLDTGGVVIMLNELLLDHIYLYSEHSFGEDKAALLNSAQKYGFKALKTGLEVKSRLKQKDDTLKIGNFERNQAKTYSLLQFILVEQGLYEAGLLVSELGRGQALADLVKVKLKINTQLLVDDIPDISDDEGNLLSDKVSSVISTVGLLLSKVKSHMLFYSIIDNPLIPTETLLYFWYVQPHLSEVKVKFFQSKLNGFKNIVFDKNYFASMVHEIRGSASIQSLTMMPSRDIIKKKTASSLVIATAKQTAPQEQSKLEELYSLLIQPVLEYMPSISDIRLIIIPHGFLFNVPFSALKGPDHYLIEKFTISLLPSVFFLQLSLCKNKRSSSSPHDDELKVLAIGNPKMPLKEIDQLPGAEAEAKSLLGIVDGKLMSGTEANKVNVMKHLPDFPVIHFATHAILEDSLHDYINLENSTQDTAGDYSVKGAIVLAQSDPTCSGVLTSSEIMKIDLNCELVVLSCCNTARGKITSDGVLGLSRSFMCSGATNMILTLWPIHDSSTSLLMKHFYINYKSTRDPAIALQYAVVNLIRNHYKVSHWAPFCNFGIKY